MKVNLTFPALALAILLLAFQSTPAWAELSESCKIFKTQIIEMEDQMSSAAALDVDLNLRRLFREDCLKHPTRNPDHPNSDPWFNAKGEPASGPPGQGDGVYQTTAAHADYCRASWNPQLCALMLDLGEPVPMGDKYGELVPGPADPVIDPADELPPFTLNVGGRRYSIDETCLGKL